MPAPVPLQCLHLFCHCHRPFTFCFSVASASSLHPRVLVASAVFVKAHTSISNLARDLGQLQRVLSEKPYQFSLREWTPGQQPVIAVHPVFQRQGMFPVDPRFVDVSDACHSALTQLLSSTRCSSVLEEMDKGNKDNKQAKSRLEAMRRNDVLLPPALSLFMPSAIKDHRSATTLIKPPGRLSLDPRGNEVHALDAAIEYLVAFEVSQISFFFTFHLFPQLLCLCSPTLAP